MPHMLWYYDQVTPFAGPNVWICPILAQQKTKLTVQLPNRLLDTLPAWCHNREKGNYPGGRFLERGAVRRTAPVRQTMGVVMATSTVESREVMNIRQASQYLGVSPDTLYRYIYEDRIPAFKLGNRWKFKKTVLDRWMEKKIIRGRKRRGR